MLQAKDADIRREPCRIPVGPNRAPGLAVTAFGVSATKSHSHPSVPLFQRLSAHIQRGNTLVTLLPLYQESKSVGSTDSVEWGSHDGNIICVHFIGREAIGVRQICESH